MEAETVLRVVVSRHGKLKPSEFRIRQGERGLSLFRDVQSPGQGSDPGSEGCWKARRPRDRRVPIREIRELGLRLVSTPGGTSDDAVNQIHIEARLSLWRSLLLTVKRREVHDWFNETIAPRIAGRARLVELEDL